MVVERRESVSLSCVCYNGQQTLSMYCSCITWFTKKVMVLIIHQCSFATGWNNHFANPLSDIRCVICMDVVYICVCIQEQCTVTNEDYCFVSVFRYFGARTDSESTRWNTVSKWI